MKIDFHIHAFPDAVAPKAIGGLIETVKKLNKHVSGIPCTDGTEAQARRKLAEYADIGVLMPIATRSGQQAKVNDWARRAAHDGIISFGSVFPFDEDAQDELERIKSIGLYGVKLHPDYQGFDVDDERVFPIYEKLQDMAMPVLFHAGVDPVSLDHIHCRPEAVRKVAEKFPEMRIVAAHLGGNLMYEESKEHLLCAGLENLYVDCSMAGFFTTPNEMLEGIRMIGADKVLFATDLPWSDGSTAVKRLDTIGLNEHELDLIFSNNALKLLGLSEDDVC